MRKRGRVKLWNRIAFSNELGKVALFTLMLLFQRAELYLLREKLSPSEMILQPQEDCAEVKPVKLI